MWAPNAGDSIAWNFLVHEYNDCCIAAGLSWGRDAYMATNGTSFAAPYATAVAAHVLTVAGMYLNCTV